MEAAAGAAEASMLTPDQKKNLVRRRREGSQANRVSERQTATPNPDTLSNRCPPRKELRGRPKKLKCLRTRYL